MHSLYSYLPPEIRRITNGVVELRNSRDCPKQTSRPCKDEAECCCLGNAIKCPHNNCQNNLEAKIAEA